MTGSAAFLLAFDSSTETLSIAADGPLGTAAWNGPGGAQASATLLPRAREMLRDVGLEWQDLTAIAFGAGPGAFTGLRTACAVAQGLALGIGCPLLAVDSLTVVAEDAAGEAPDGEAERGPWWVAMDARMDEIYAGEYVRDADGWRALRAPALYTLAALQDAWAQTPPQRIAGSALAVFGARLTTFAARCVASEGNRAAALLRVAQHRQRAGAGVDAALAMPVYLRDKVALTIAERAAP